MTQPQFGERAEYGPGDVCYRHADRPSFTLCQRCGRTICPDCQTQNAVGLLCPECVRELQPATVHRAQRAMRANVRKATASETPLVTYTLMAICIAVWALQLFSNSITQLLWYIPVYSTAFAFEPWHIITSVFTHSPSSIFHLVFNMFALWMFGPQLEAMLGRLHFLALYLLSGIGGNLAVMWWAFADPTTIMVPNVGASGAIFGLVGATFVVYRKLNISTTSLALVIGLNLAISFMPGSNISWQAHIGGMLFGALIVWLYSLTRTPKRKPLSALVPIGVAAAQLASMAAFYFLSLS